MENTSNTLLVNVAIGTVLIFIAGFVFARYHKGVNLKVFDFLRKLDSEEQETAITDAVDIEMKKRTIQPVIDEYQDKIHLCRVDVFNLAAEIVSCRYKNEMVALGYEIETIEDRYTNLVEKDILVGYLRMLYDVHDAESERLHGVSK